MQETPTAVVFGASGQVGMPLVARLRAQGWQVLAVSRGPQADAPGLHWLQGGFAAPPPLPDGIDAVCSCGPLDLFARWHADAGPQGARVVAFGSTSVHAKRDSSDAGERDLARRLRAAEAELFASAGRRGAAVTLLRPTLVYGAGRDASLSRIADIARHHGRFVLPRGSTGLRQPVHVDDLADAVLAALRAPASQGRGYDLPGGETLPYREMVRRVLACLRPSPRLHELPMPLFRLLLKAARARGIAGGLTDAAVARMREDLVFDPEPARRDFGYAPRAFTPEADMFGA